MKVNLGVGRKGEFRIFFQVLRIANTKAEGRASLPRVSGNTRKIGVVRGGVKGEDSEMSTSQRRAATGQVTWDFLVHCKQLRFNFG